MKRMPFNDRKKVIMGRNARARNVIKSRLN